MSIEVKGKIIETDEEGYLLNLEDWNCTLSDEYKPLKNHPIIICC